MITQKMKDWNGKKVEFAYSKGCVCVLAHPFDNLIKSGCEPWPSPEVIQKLYRSNQVHSFDDSHRVICESGIGYYCDLQSLHSEDAITWSVFGTAARAGRDKLKHWIADLFHLLNLENASTEHAEVVLWRRIPHPDTLGFGGPEIDFGIITENSVIFGEAKWLSGVGKTQGKHKDKDQIQLRSEFLEKQAKYLFPGALVKAVVGVSLFPNAFINTVPSGIPFKQITWEQVCSLASHPYANEVQRYFKWKKKYTRMPGEKK